MLLWLYIDTSATLITAALCVQKIDGANDTASGMELSQPSYELIYTAQTKSFHMEYTCVM